MEMSKELQDVIGKDGYDFYSCYKCKSLITALRMARAMYSDGKICKCGSMTVNPCNLKWYHWFRPDVLYFAYLRLRGIA